MSTTVTLFKRVLWLPVIPMGMLSAISASACLRDEHLWMLSFSRIINLCERQIYKRQDRPGEPARIDGIATMLPG